MDREPLDLSKDTEAKIAAELEASEAEARAGHTVPMETALQKVRDAMTRMQTKARIATLDR